jgi:hypothetical protein
VTTFASRSRSRRSRAKTSSGRRPVPVEQEDGTPADPPLLHTAVPTWQAGDTIPLGAGRALRVIATNFVDEEPVLVVEPA